jgi:predicted nucleic acid-binding protein
MKVFFDTNILLDVLMDRAPFARDSATVWSLAETGQIGGYISAISFNNIYYIIHKLRDHQTAMKAMRLLRDTFDTVSLDERIIQQAIDASFKDFEDAVQYFSAVRARSSCILSRNVSHFPDKPVAITPADFLASYSFD